MYAKGMSTGDIETHIQDIYGVSISSSTVSRITDKNLPIAKEQRSALPFFWKPSMPLWMNSPADALDTFGERWDKKYPKISLSCRTG